jgi:hypothetical protein
MKPAHKFACLAGELLKDTEDLRYGHPLFSHLTSPWARAGPLVSGRYGRTRLVNLLADLQELVSDHHPHGTLTTGVTEPAWNGYLLQVACPCGVTFERWVTPEDAELDLLRLASLN